MNQLLKKINISSIDNTLNNLTDKDSSTCILITGASSGIGYQAAVNLLNNGWMIIKVGKLLLKQ